MKDRIKQLMESQHMTQKSFSEFLEKSQGTISSIFTGRTRPTLDIIEAIKTKFPEVSINWLLFGTGEMYVSKPETTNESPIEMTDKHEPTLFDFNPSEDQNSAKMQNNPDAKNSSKFLQSGNSQAVPAPIVQTPRKIKEIRVFYDDQTWETFVPATDK